MNNFNLTEWALEHRAVVLFLIIVIGVAGVFSFSKLGQLEDPKFSVPSMTATVIWPGASAQQIQDEVLNRMEKKFEQLDHFEKVVTFARQGYGGMTITVKGGTSGSTGERLGVLTAKALILPLLISGSEVPMPSNISGTWLPITSVSAGVEPL